MQLYAGSTGTLSHNGDIFRITTEGSNVVLYPLDRGHLVVQTVVTGNTGFFLQLRQAHKAHRSKAVIQSNTDDALFRPHRTVEMLFVTAPAGESAAVDIHQNRQLITLPSSIRGEHIQKQAVLAVSIGFALAEFIIVENLLKILFFIVKCPGLVAASAVFCGIVHTLPMGDLLRIFPAAGSGITNALVASCTCNPARLACQHTARGVHNIFHKNPP